jgi:hypothetical protein
MNYYSRVTHFRAALYRDFPDPQRESGTHPPDIPDLS